MPHLCELFRRIAQSKNFDITELFLFIKWWNIAKIAVSYISSSLNRKIKFQFRIIAYCRITWMCLLCVALLSYTCHIHVSYVSQSGRPCHDDEGDLLDGSHTLSVRLVWVTLGTNKWEMIPCMSDLGQTNDFFYAGNDNTAVQWLFLCQWKMKIVSINRKNNGIRLFRSIID